MLQRVYRRIEMIKGDYSSREEAIAIERAEANVSTTEVVGWAKGMHAPMFDLDIPHTYLPSGTAGHGHLYIDTPVSWRNYKRVLRAMVRAGIIERGFYKATVRRGYGSLRLPEKAKVTMR